jgi:hypothetical protein
MLKPFAMLAFNARGADAASASTTPSSTARKRVDSSPSWAYAQVFTHTFLMDLSFSSACWMQFIRFVLPDPQSP